MKKRIIYLSTVLLVTLCSCVRDTDPGCGPVQPGETSVVTFGLNLPGQIVQTYATIDGTSKENEIRSIYVLAFKIDPANPGTETYEYKAVGSNIQDDGSSDHKKFKATVFKKDYNQRFVIIANAEDKIQAINDADIGKTKEELLSELVYENTDKWHSEAIVHTPLPMWGESGKVVINDFTTTVERIKMLRMVSRIDVTLSTPAAQDMFELANLRVYNYHASGRIVPDQGDHCWDSINHVVKTVSMPDACDKIRGPHDFEVVNASGNIYLPSVYLFEATAAETDAASEATCLVIGGIYDNDPKETYYRVDFFEKDDKEQVTGYMELLRNHLYRVQITEIQGSGYETPEEAFHAKSQNMSVEIIPWNDGEISDIVFDNQYMLGVNPGSMTVSKEQGQYEIVVYTDVPTGWKASIDKTAYTWLDAVSTPEGPAGSKQTFTFSVTENSDALRTGEIVFSAGRLRYTVKITQTVAQALSLTLTSDRQPVEELIFRCHTGEAMADAQELTVSWSPAAEAVTVSSIISGIKAFDASAGDDPALTGQLLDPSGSKTFTIRPPVMLTSEFQDDPFLEKASLFYFTIGRGEQVITKTALLRQIHYDLLADPEDPYDLDGNPHSFSVRCNVPWTAVVKSNDGSIVSSSITSSGTANTTTGVPFQFTTTHAEQTGMSSGAVVITFTYYAHDGYQFTKDITLTFGGKIPDYDEPGSNSYLLKPGSDAISIPVSWANGESNRISSTEVLKADLLWTDHPDGMAPTAAVRGYSIEGTGSSAKLIVTPGTGKGNAVIAVRNATTDEIKWSWHIWVSDYDPDTDAVYDSTSGLTYMARNLGALSHARADESSFGLLYQWGRKDPFPGLAGRSSTAPVTIYKADKSQTSTTSENVLTAVNLDNTIRQPMAFYIGKDWYTNNSNWGNTRDDFWWSGSSGNLSKTQYDPCPPGWRIPVDASHWAGNPFGNLNEDGSWQNYGVVYSTAGYWIAAGYRSGTTGDYALGSNNSALVGYYWGGGTMSQSYAYGLHFFQGNSDNDYNNDRTFGHSIRCAKQ